MAREFPPVSGFKRIPFGKGDGLQWAKKLFESGINFLRMFYWFLRNYTLLLSV